MKAYQTPEIEVMNFDIMDVVTNGAESNPGSDEEI